MEQVVTPQTAEDTKDKKNSPYARDVWSVISKGELPFWWTAGTSLTAASDPSFERRHKKLLEKLKLEEARIYAVIKELKNAQKEEEENYIRALAAQTLVFSKKEEELKQYEAEQVAVYQQTLMNTLNSLEEEIHDNELRDISNKALEKELEIMAESDRQQKEISDKIDSAMIEVAAEKEKAQSLEETFKQLMEERNRLFPMSKDENGSYLGFFEKKYEAFNPENVLEIKEISLFDTDERKYVLHIPSLSVRRGRVTVIRSFRQNLTMIERLLYHSTASSVHIHTGEIRFDGRVISSVTREEYKKMLGTEIMSVNLTVDEIRRSEKNVFAHFGLKKDEKALVALMEEFGLPKEFRRMKCCDMPEEERTIAALCYVLSRKPKLALLEETFHGLSKPYFTKLRDFLNKDNPELTVLLFTQNKSVCVSLGNSRLYVV